jgi:hypothetical protein
MKTIPEKYHAYIEMVISVARGFLSEGDELQAMAFLGKLGAGIVPIPMHMGHKDQSAAMIREICKVTRPDCVMMISEAWALDQTNVPVEEVERIANSGGSIADHPNRQDVVMLVVETREGLWLGQGQIKSLGGKARGFDDLQFEMKGKVQGRFSSFLPREGTAH